MQRINFDYANNNLESVMDKAIDESDGLVMERHGGEDVVVISQRHFNSLMDTMHLLSSPANTAHLTRSIDQYLGWRDNCKMD